MEKNPGNLQQNQLATPGTRVLIREVGPRDGLQNEKLFLPAQIKMELIKRLADAGISAIEATSFVSPRAVPQLCDAEAVLEGMGELAPGVVLSALVGNAAGVQRALGVRQPALRDIVVVVSASEAHNQANLKRSVTESLSGLDDIRRLAAGRFMVRGAVATAFGCPSQGWISSGDVFRVVDSMMEAGIKEITLADTAGMGEPEQVENLVGGVRERYPGITLALHLHDTRGRGMENARAGVEAGVKVMESSVGGLGGCPFLHGAVGNVSTGKLVGMLHGIGVETGIDLQRLSQCVRFLEEVLDRRLGG